MRVLIADDEPLSRENVELLLARHPDVSAVASCATGEAAVSLAATFHPDVVLLDIRMPGIDGFEVVRALGTPPPLVVFVTAHDEHAVAAFETAAVDYLLKPFDDARFDRMLDRVRDRLASRAGREPKKDPKTNVEAAGASTGPAASYAERLVIREVGRVRIVPVRAIDWIEAQGVYACLHHEGRATLLRSTMDRLARELDPARFVRVHRSAIVRRDRVQSLRPNQHGDYVVVLTCGTELPLSRRRKAALASLLAQA
ncbi:MAG: LytTR family DNA-binding domain-containing protein [Vicinamibacterales bacterium]